MALFLSRHTAMAAMGIIGLIMGIPHTGLAQEATSFSCPAGPASASLSKAKAVASPSTGSLIPITPKQIDMAIQALDGIVANALTHSGVPGLAIAVVHNDGVVYAKGFGVRDVGTNQPVDKDTVFQLASVSKPLGATVIARLVGQGVVDWNTRVIKYLPDFALADRDVTRQLALDDLYSHRSGLPEHAGDLLEDMGYNRAQILRKLRLEPLEPAPFRTHYDYTNFGITAAAEAVANASGMSWEKLSRQALYEPLGMSSTSSSYADYAKAPNRAELHVPVGDHWEARYKRNADAQSPAGGASSSVADMAQWLRLQLANGKFDGVQIVDTEALSQTRCPYMMTSPPDTPLERASFYGLGIGLGYDDTGRLRLTHSGAFGLGAATTVAMLPSENLGIVVLTNGMPVGVPEAVAASFFDLVERGRIQRDWLTLAAAKFAEMFKNPSKLDGATPPANPAPGASNSVLAGTYANDYYGPTRIETRNAGLVLTLGPDSTEFPLQHWDGNTFAYFPSGENAVGISAVSFSVEGGKAVTVTIENLDKNGLGTFKRQ
jgi:CubicO group peptidase (beta-lactamase class C family)